MKKIPLTQGKFALIDDEDFESVSLYKWCVYRGRHGWYVERYLRVDGRRTTQQLHRFLLSAPKGVEVDHINGDGLDNQRSNLRLATAAQNQANRCVSANNTSGYKGVAATKRGWHAQIEVRGKKYHLGYFGDKLEAARAYDVAAIEYFGEFARLNKV